MFKLSKFCDESLVRFDLKGKTKHKVIEELVEVAAASKSVKDQSLLLKDVVEREKLVTTGVGYGVAFPHAKTKSVRGIVIAFGRSKEGVDFEAMDKRPVQLFFLIAAPEEAIGAHLNVMAKLSHLMKSQENRDRLLEAQVWEAVAEVLDGV